MGFGNNLRVARLARGLTLTELAEIIEVTKAAISVFELGYKYPKSSTLVKLSKTLGVSLDYLMSSEGVSVKRACEAEIGRAVAALAEKSIRCGQ